MILTRHSQTPHHGRATLPRSRFSVSGSNAGSAGASPYQRTSRMGVALVITLLMLSVITFLAIAFLAMTSRDKAAVSATQDMENAKAMSDAALARAQTEIIAQMMSVTDVLSYDYRASHNYISPSGFFNNGVVYPYTNVNYDYINNNGTLKAYNAGSDPADWAQNISNLWYDPRPPVFVQTGVNSATGQPIVDFRYWVDLNRNGAFESNGIVNNLDINGNLIPGSSGYYNGEPEWIGMLKYPETNHSWTNLFIGRYAFLVLPIGKTLDWNFIHNYSKANGSPYFSSPTYPDYFSRDEGVGSWELNLAALLNDINTNIYPPSGANAYVYRIGPGTFNAGRCFYDAAQVMNFRYAGYPSGFPTYPLTFASAINMPINTLTNTQINIDEYGGFPNTVFPLDYNQYSTEIPYQQRFTWPWPGSYNTNMLYDIQGAV